MTAINRCPGCGANVNPTETSCHDCGLDLRNVETSTGGFYNIIPQAPKSTTPSPNKNVLLNSSKKELIFNSKTKTYHYAADSNEDSDVDEIERRKKECPECPEIEGRDFKSKEFKQIMMAMRSPVSDEFDDRSKDARWGVQVAETWDDLGADR